MTPFAPGMGVTWTPVDGRARDAVLVTETRSGRWLITVDGVNGRPDYPAFADPEQLAERKATKRRAA